MTDVEIMALIQKAVREETGDTTAVLTATTTAVDVDGWDSLAHGRIMLAIQMATMVRFEIEKTYGATNVGELIGIIRAALEENTR
jgi:acyl carrier protein